MTTLAQRERSHHAPHHAPTVDESLLARIRGEYDEMPGLSLTPAQAERLWQLDRETCRAALNRLVQRRVLSLTARGRYVRHEA
jgi:hypothetical protein